VVVEIGSNVTKVKVGDRVACRWTTHSLYCAIHEDLATIIPDNVSFEEASLVNIATFPMAAIRKCKLEMGESAIVMGLGILGMMAIKELRLAGAAPIVAVDPVAERRALALKYGADYAFDPFEEGFAKKVKEVTVGGANVAIEVTGKGQGLDMVLDCMARFGRVALLGCTRNPDFTIDYYRKVHYPGITMIGAHTQCRPPHDSAPGWWTEKDDRMTLMNFYRLGRMNLSSMVEETHKPEEAPEVYTRLATERFFPLVQFDWRNME
jgi:threonine dehydrogenase-like Zn-dependent dehydrogenase